MTARQLAELMVGSELPVAGDPRVDRHRPEVVLQVRGLTVARRGRPAAARRRLASTIHAGEVLGIAGVEGNGQAELVEAIMGMRPRTRAPCGSATGTSTELDTRRRREAGIGYIPEDRQRQGLLLEAPLWENRMLGHQTEPPNVTGP